MLSFGFAGTLKLVRIYLPNPVYRQSFSKLGQIALRIELSVSLCLGLEQPFNAWVSRKDTCSISYDENLIGATVSELLTKSHL